LVIALVGQMSSGLMTAIQAKGKIAVYQITISLLLLMNLPAAYILQKHGFEPVMVLWIMLVIEIVCLVARLVAASFFVGISTKNYFKDVVFKFMIVSIPTTFIAVIGKLYIGLTWSSFGHLLLSTGVTILLVPILSYICFDKREKQFVISYGKKIIGKIKN
jgi:hypothetical protein